jgi:hypothetical protein
MIFHSTLFVPSAEVRLGNSVWWWVCNSISRRKMENSAQEKLDKFDISGNDLGFIGCWRRCLRTSRNSGEIRNAEPGCYNSGFALCRSISTSSSDLQADTTAVCRPNQFVQYKHMNKESTFSLKGQKKDSFRVSDYKWFFPPERTLWHFSERWQGCWNESEDADAKSATIKSDNFRYLNHILNFWTFPITISFHTNKLLSILEQIGLYILRSSFVCGQYIREQSMKHENNDEDCRNNEVYCKISKIWLRLVNGRFFQIHARTPRNVLLIRFSQDSGITWLAALFVKW